MCGRFTVLTRDEISDVVAAVEHKMGLASSGMDGDESASANDLQLTAFEGTECIDCGMCGGSVGSTRVCWQSENSESAQPDRRAASDTETAYRMPRWAIERRQAFPDSIVDTFGLREGGLAIGAFTWGFPVEWSKGPVFNTRIESALAGRGMWRDLVRDGRCIVPVASFFEPHATETIRSARTGRQVKRAYEFAAPDGSPLLLAGLSDGTHCSIVTTEPNAQVAPIHRRMPLALSLDEVALWLDGGPSTWASLANRSAFPLFVAPDPRQGQSTPDESASGAPGVEAKGSQEPDEPVQLSLF